VAAKLGSEILRGIKDVTISTKYGLSAEYPSPSKRRAQQLYRQAVRPLLAHLPRLKQSLRSALSWRQRLPLSTEPPSIARAISKLEICDGVERSLNLLQRDRIEIFLLHEPDQFILDSAAAQVLEEIQSLGKIAAFGLAYSRVNSPPPAFGSIVQCHFESSVTLPRRPEQRVVTHGVVGLQDPTFKFSPPRYGIEEFFRRGPSSVLLFSASSPHQINEVSAIFGEARAKYDARNSALLGTDAVDAENSPN